MDIEDAQREVRTVFMHGFPGQVVSGLLWLLSAGLSTWVSTRSGIIVLVVGGMFILPGTLLLLKVMGRPTSLRKTNPLGRLAMQIAFTIPLNLPLVGAAAIHDLHWFYPACMIVVGSHYLPFWFLYGMREFSVLAFALVLGGLLLGGLLQGLYIPGPFAAGGWLTGVALLLFAVAGRSIAARRDAQMAADVRREA